MRCAWSAYINLLPLWMRETVDNLGRDVLLELRLRIGLPPELLTINGAKWLSRNVTRDDLSFCVNAASQYSPWAHDTVSSGYITAPGGHRIGLCGVVSGTADRIAGIREPTSLCLRVARDFPGISGTLAEYSGSILIIGKPGSGKTTLLRDMIRRRSEYHSGSICVVDEKGEIFPSVGPSFCFPIGKRTDVITGCRKTHGIDMVLRNMSPDTIAVDEITAQEDCKALLHAGWCGVKLIATAHAGNRSDLLARPIYRPIVDSAIFDILVVLQSDKSWRLERMNG